ncbi:MAG: Acetyltransferase, GNAT family [uncultured Rubrobacteraceae bacterium]|uniref:Acetyltransferase, GNAT family n=1 Tax=uncultured Rubrobacteraceae bacterium TaxID=349277 RepID=A0A6J4R2B4_9ACTN|nr:MAG: Acetyltransferase, GNAT family [uncultured Rubrobacteraceae bacterium]
MTRRVSTRAGDKPKDLSTIETDRLILRKMTPGDADAVFAYASDPEVTRYVIWDAHRTIEDSRAFLDLTIRGYESGADPAWGIVYKGDHRFVGTCGFTSLEAEHARAEIGYVISREYRGRGLAPEAVRAMIRFGFERMDLNRIEARCIAENTASARVMRKAGMTHEGTLHQREFIKGSYRDMELYAILKSEHRLR